MAPLAASSLRRERAGSSVDSVCGVGPTAQALRLEAIVSRAAGGPRQIGPGGRRGGIVTAADELYVQGIDRA